MLQLQRNTVCAGTTRASKLAFTRGNLQKLQASKGSKAVRDDSCPELILAVHRAVSVSPTDERG